MSDDGIVNVLACDLLGSMLHLAALSAVDHLESGEVFEDHVAEIAQLGDFPEIGMPGKVLEDCGRQRCRHCEVLLKLTDKAAMEKQLFNPFVASVCPNSPVG